MGNVVPWAISQHILDSQARFVFRTSLPINPHFLTTQCSVKKASFIPATSEAVPLYCGQFRNSLCSLSTSTASPVTLNQRMPHMGALVYELSEHQTALRLFCFYGNSDCGLGAFGRDGSSERQIIQALPGRRGCRCSQIKGFLSSL